MSVTPYCTQADIESVFSLNGVVWAVDDDRSGEAETSNEDGNSEPSYVTDAIERATVKINQYLAMWYDLTTLPSNTWTKWACAILAARALARRRGSGAPDGLVADADEVLEYLELVSQGKALIPQDGASDAQLLSQNAGLTMSNLAVDSRFRIAKVRAVTRISTGPANSRLLRYIDYRQITAIE